MSSFRSDPERTRERAVELDDYMTRCVYGANGFVCASGPACRRAALTANGQPRSDRNLYEGQMSHVGLHYDTELVKSSETVKVSSSVVG